MSPEKIIFIVIGVVAAITVIALIYSNSVKKSQYFQLLSSFGRLKKYEFTYEEYESIAHYFKNVVKDNEFHIDDITWNDLDMDKIFMMINNTNSSVGRDYLYKILRTPVSDSKVLEERERLIRFFKDNETERTKIMHSMSNIGFTRKISISDHVDRFLQLKPESNLYHYLIILLIIIAVVFTVTIDPVMGIVLILASVGTSIITYYKTKSRIDSYFTCVKHIVSMVTAAKEISRLGIETLDSYNEVLNRNVSQFRKVTRNAWLLVSGKSGSLADVILEYVRMFTHVDLIKFNSILRHMGKNKDQIYELMETLGILESMISIASFRELLPYYCNPEFISGSKMELKDVYHLSIKEPVANSITEDKPVLITGSNASGKSTFLKSVAINTILAQTINTCPCEKYRAPFYRVYSSMALSDDLDMGESYYIVEIKSLKRIVDASHTEGPQILCFIDEVLRGTNTVERIAASSQILKDLSDSGVMCFAATHDIELTHILEKYYSNYHFDEEVVDEKVIFSYSIKTGRATSRNAIRLLGIIGYDENIITNSEDRANDFINTGVWRQFQ